MKVSPQTILNWLKEGAEFLKGGMCRIKRRLLKKDTAIYVDETWVDTKVKQADGSFKYVKRYTRLYQHLDNCCERAVRPFTNLRKSFGGFSSELGGEVAAAWLTFVESCKLQKKAALEVFNGYFQRIAEGRRDFDLITEEVLC